MIPQNSLQKFSGNRSSPGRLFLSETSVPDEELRTKDPIKFLVQEVEAMDINAIIK